jgi:hypothetical protein
LVGIERPGSSQDPLGRLLYSEPVDLSDTNIYEALLKGKIFVFRVKKIV